MTKLDKQRREITRDNRAKFAAAKATSRATQEQPRTHTLVRLAPTKERLMAGK